MCNKSYLFGSKIMCSSTGSLVSTHLIIICIRYVSVTLFMIADIMFKGILTQMTISEHIFILETTKNNYLANHCLAQPPQVNKFLGYLLCSYHCDMQHFNAIMDHIITNVYVV